MPAYGVDAVDIDPMEIVAVQDLHDSMPDIDNRLLLNARYGQDGYVFFRGLLPLDAIDAARSRMLRSLVECGLVSDVTDRARWMGVTAENVATDAAAFAGVWQKLFEWPGCAKAFEKILGEPASPVPMVQYRAYPPGGALGRVHQDGYFSPGIRGYRPVWLPLVHMDASVGGLVLAVGQTGRGYFHNTDKPPRCNIPQDVISEAAWGRADYMPGDVLVIHPETPHVGLPNRSDRVRLSIDTRVQSAASPSIIVGELTFIATDSIVVRCGTEGHCLRVGNETFLRTGIPQGRRQTCDEFVEKTPLNLRVLASREGDLALMVRRADDG